MTAGARQRVTTAREVLDQQVTLHRSLTAMDARHREFLKVYAATEVADYPEWAASHLHPMERLRPDGLRDWLETFATDLFGATAFQVTAEMVDLATSLEPGTPDLEALPDEEVPVPWGFMWLDETIPRPAADDGGREPERIRAVSWARVPQMRVRADASVGTAAPVPFPEAETGGRTFRLPGLRIRDWADDGEGGLSFMGQATVPLSDRIRSPLPQIRMVHMLWILMGMEIVTSEPAQLDRATVRRARDLRHQQVTIVQLRRTHHESDPDAPRPVNWSCRWLVRGHRRRLADGRTVWVRPYIKGPDGKPLKASDIVYRLER